MITDMALDKECLSCLDSLREVVGSHRIKHRGIDVDDGAGIWLCANDECGNCKLGMKCISN